MGYRSQVAAAIYPDTNADTDTSEKYGALKLLMSTQYEYVYKEFAGSFTWNDDRRRLEFEGDFKWYESYEDVQAFHQFLSDARELGYCTEFARVGEDDDDIHTSYNGDNVQYFVNVQRSVTID
jgi:hypothetical protein